MFFIFRSRPLFAHDLGQPRTKLLKIVIMIYKWYVKLTSLRDRVFIYHDMSLISFFISWYVTNFIFLYYDISVISFDLLWYVSNFFWFIMICHLNFVVICCNAISWYITTIYHDILRWFIMIYYDDLSWYITTIYHYMSKRSMSVFQGQKSLVFFSFDLWDIVIYFKNIFQRYIMIY